MVPILTIFMSGSEGPLDRFETLNECEPIIMRKRSFVNQSGMIGHISAENQLFKVQS